MLTRREAIRALSISSAAALAVRWLPNRAHAQSASTSDQAGLQSTPAAPINDLFSLAPLPYEPEALEPYIDATTMRIHYGKHHAAYVNNLNKAIASYPALSGQSVESLIRDLSALPEDIRLAVRNNGGGHVNHTLFWETLSPRGGGAPTGALGEALEGELGGFEVFRDAMTRAALSVFGSGWAWLSLDSDGHLLVESLPNQDSPIMFGRTPLFGIDVWEHAYYLKYQNRRAEYVAAIWNIVNWPAVEMRYAAAMGA